MSNGAITPADIRAAIEGVTGAPTSGVVWGITPGLIRAIDALINGEPDAPEKRVIKAPETRKTDSAGQ